MERQPEPLLHPDPAEPGQAFPPVDDGVLGRADRSHADRDPARHRGDRHLHLQGRPARLRGEEAVRGGAEEPAAPVRRDRQRLDPRGDVALPVRETLPCLQRRAPAAGGAVGQDRRPHHRRRVRAADPSGAGMVRHRGGHPHPAARRDRPAHPARDPRPAALPRRCRARLPDPVARLGHPVRRREPAHPSRQPDRLRPDRGALRPGRALDRPAPARQ